MNNQKLTIKLLEDLDACKEGVDLVNNNNLEGFPLEKLSDIKGDFKNFKYWLEDSLKSVKLEYDSKGNKTSEKELDSSGNVQLSYEYTYDSEGNKTSEKWLDSFGNVLGSYEYTYDLKGNKTSKKWLDSSGRVVWSEEYTYIHYDNGQLNKILDSKTDKVLIEIPKF
jgi:hypothetical protein